ncbi:hypothetical protein OLZ31_06465 [Enterobacter asburiae]|nr:hypothetical protein [Enterobacter asburiae]
MEFTKEQLSDDRLVKIISETQAVVTEHNSRCVRGSVEVDARLFESMLIEIQLRRHLMEQQAAMLQGADGNSPAQSGCHPAKNCISPEQCGNSPVIPDGWKLAPPEPTTKQWAAGMKAFDSGMDKVTRVYKAMIAAAPQQEVKP